MVDQSGGIDDQVDGVGQPLPSLLIQAEIRLAFVAGDDLQMLGGQLPVVPEQLWIAAVEGFVQARTSCRVVLGADQADQLAADKVHRSSHSNARYRPRKPVAPVNRTVRTSTLGPGSVGAAASVLASMNRSSVRSLACTTVAPRPCTRRECRPHRGRCPLGLDVVGDGLQVGGRADDHPDRHVDVEDLVQQVGECQRGQGVPAQVGEMRVGKQIGGRRAQQGSRGSTDRLQHRPVGAALAQLAQLVDLTFGQVGVQLLEPLAVVLLELRAAPACGYR